MESRWTLLQYLLQNNFFCFSAVIMEISFYIWWNSNELMQEAKLNVRAKMIWIQVENLISGLGNLMFQYASLRAIAESCNAKLIVPSKCTLRRGFRLDAITVSDELNDELIRRYGRNERHFAVSLESCKSFR